jgi:hypothetical protein
MHVCMYVCMYVYIYIYIYVYVYVCMVLYLCKGWAKIHQALALQSPRAIVLALQLVMYAQHLFLC